MKKDKDDKVIRETGSAYGESQKETRRKEESARAKKGEKESAEGFKPTMEQALKLTEKRFDKALEDLAK